MKRSATKRQHPSPAHESRVELLRSLGVFLGYRKTPAPALPDGSEPDLFQFDPDRHRLLLGDAEATETPGNGATRLRLHHYVMWARRHASNGDVTLLLCTGAGRHAKAWLKLLLMLAHEENLTFYSHGIDKLDVGATLIWATTIPEQLHFA